MMIDIGLQSAKFINLKKLKLQDIGKEAQAIKKISKECEQNKANN